jgi:hypothetical protein
MVRLDTSSCNFPSSCSFFVHADLTSRVPRMRVYSTGMTVKLTEKTQELNTALLKVIVKDKCSMFHALETTQLSSYRILYVPGRSTWWTMNDPSQGG